MGRGWWQGRLCPSFIQFGYAILELVQRMQIYDAYDRCGYALAGMTEMDKLGIQASGSTLESMSSIVDTSLGAPSETGVRA